MLPRSLEFGFMLASTRPQTVQDRPTIVPKPRRPPHTSTLTSNIIDSGPQHGRFLVFEHVRFHTSRPRDLHTELNFDPSPNKIGDAFFAVYKSTRTQAHAHTRTQEHKYPILKPGPIRDIHKSNAKREVRLTGPKHPIDLGTANVIRT